MFAAALASLAFAAQPAPGPPPPPGRNYIYTYFSMADYPADARRRHQQGIVRFAITIGLDGHVADCRILGSSGVPSLDEATCRIVRERVRYLPARDSQGRPVASEDGPFSISWRLPE